MTSPYANGGDALRAIGRAERWRKNHPGQEPPAHIRENLEAAEAYVEAAIREGERELRR